MILDNENKLSDAQAFTATAVSTNAVDLGLANNQAGTGEEIGIAVNVEVAADFTSANETYEFQAVSDDAAALSSTTLLASITIAAATLIAGYSFFIPIPPGVSERYIGLRLVLAGTTPSITLSAYVQPRSMFNKRSVFADGFTIS